MSTHNHAMDPVGLQGALHPTAHADAPAHADGHAVEAPAAPRVEVGRLGFKPAEIGKAALYIGSLLAIMAGLALALATGLALLHLGFKQLVGPVFEDTLSAANWANAIGTIVLVSLSFVMVLATLLTMGERKWSALMQDRMGPNRARLAIPGLRDKALFGLPHILADVFKMLTKEEIVPAMGSKLIFHLAPAIAFAPAFVLFAIVPMTPTFTWLGQRITLTVAAYPTLQNGQIEFLGIDQGLLYLFAIASIAVLGTTLAGWASNNKYALLGGMRAAAQMVSYEVTLGMTLVGLMIIFQTLRLDVMTQAQAGYIWGFIPAWGVFLQPLAILAYFAAASAEIKRAPFDLPEGESEIVGYYIEYSGLKFGIFMIAEFVEVVVFAGVFTALFFGGYHLPWGEEWLAGQIGESWMGIVYATTFIAKTVFFCWLSLIVRWTFPRFRYDQVMNLGWKMLLPASILNVVITGIVVLAFGMSGAATFGLIQFGLILFFVVGAFRLKRSGLETLLPSESATAPAAAGGHH